MPIEGETDLATVDPSLAAQWHPTKNGDLLPNGVTISSNKKVWWKCKHGHEWEASPNNRSKGKGCPYCAGNLPIIGETDLATVNPELAAQWHPIKNGNLRPIDVTAHSGKKVHWICKKGHEWEARIYSRNGGCGCPYCSGRLPILGETDLATVNPELAAQWHPTKNGNLRPIDVTAHSGKKVWWVCEKGHEWEATISNRSKKRKCPYCSGRLPIVGETDLATVNPKLAAQWHPTKNGDLLPTQYTVSAKKKVWWLCEHGHEWEATINGRNSKKSGCPQCEGKKPIVGETDLLTVNPKVAAQWHPTKNGTLLPTQFTAGSHKKIWWRCECGYEWEATIKGRCKDDGCPCCTGSKLIVGKNDLATVNPELAARWHPTKNGDLLPTQVTAYSHRMVWWLCKEGHESRATVATRSKGNICPKCKKRNIQRAKHI